MTPVTSDEYICIPNATTKNLYKEVHSETLQINRNSKKCSRRHSNPKCLCNNHQTSNYMKQKFVELKGKIEKFSIILEDFNTPLSTTERTTR